jgi:hypothetical protein
MLPGVLVRQKYGQRNSRSIGDRAKFHPSEQTTFILNKYLAKALLKS